MWIIALREEPSRPWEFVTWHSGTQREAQTSADLTRTQERTIFGHSKAEVLVLTEVQWIRKAAGVRRKKRAAKPKKEGRMFLGIRI